MNVNLAFWVFAYALTLVAILLAFSGVRAAKKGDLETHARLMRFACNLILFFVVSYVVKMFALGREDKSQWTDFYLVVLYIHETLIGGMLVSGTISRVLAYKFRHSLTGATVSPLDLKRRKTHTKAGKMCILFAILALVTAGVVLYGMFVRQ